MNQSTLWKKMAAVHFTTIFANLIFDFYIFFQEETVRLRKNVAQLSSPTKVSSTTVHTQQTSVNLPPMAIAYLIVAVIFGVIIGKFIL